MQHAAWNEDANQGREGFGKNQGTPEIAGWSRLLPTKSHHAGISTITTIISTTISTITSTVILLLLVIFTTIAAISMRASLRFGCAVPSRQEGTKNVPTRQLGKESRQTIQHMDTTKTNTQTIKHIQNETGEYPKS